MAGLKLRLFIVAGIMLAFAGWVFLTPKPGPIAGHTEQWMEKIAPMEVGAYHFVPGDPGVGNSLCTYKSPKMVYDTLVPTVGILARVYESRGEHYDVNLIASRA